MSTLHENCIGEDKFWLDSIREASIWGKEEWNLAYFLKPFIMQHLLLLLNIYISNISLSFIGWFT